MSYPTPMDPAGCQGGEEGGGALVFIVSLSGLGLWRGVLGVSTASAFSWPGLIREVGTVTNTIQELARMHSSFAAGGPSGFGTIVVGKTLRGRCQT